MSRTNFYPQAVTGAVLDELAERGLDVALIEPATVEAAIDQVADDGQVDVEQAADTVVELIRKPRS